MKIVVYEPFGDASIRSALGRPGYSSFFVLAAVMPVLRRLGEVIQVADVADVDGIHERCLAAGEACVFLCFTLPHLVPVDLACPTIPVFGWGFPTFPCESWNDDPRHDWRVVFRHCGRAITLSRAAAAMIRAAMGEAFPVHALHAPVFERFAALGGPTAAILGARDMACRGVILDTAADARFQNDPVWPKPAPAAPLPDQPPPPAPEPPSPAAETAPEPAPRIGPRARLALTAQFFVAWYRAVLRDVLPAPLQDTMSASGRLGYRLYRRAMPRPAPVVPPSAEMVEPDPASLPELPLPPAIALRLSGVIYVSIAAPDDWSKNFGDLVSAFVWAFRDQPDASLILKMPPLAEDGLAATADWLAQHAPFRCRVVLISAFLEPAEYDSLVKAANVYVNSAACEGAALPVLEFASAGRPVIAPDHTALADSVSHRHGFVLRSSPEHNVWPHDPRRLFTTMRYRLDWTSIVEAYEQSFRAATQGGDTYRFMAARAQAAMRDLCSESAAERQLRRALAPELQGGLSAPREVAA